MKTAADSPVYQYIHFTADDCKLLQEIGWELKPEIPALVDLFYGKISQQPHLKAIISEHSQIIRLKKTFATYIEEMFSGEYNEHYQKNRIQVGLTHHRVGLELNWYLQMHFELKQILLAWLHKSYPQALFVSAAKALDKLSFFDVQLASGAYVQAFEKRVHQQRDRAVEASQVKSEFIATMSHELRTPLNAIIGFTDLVLEYSAELQENTKKHLGAVARNAKCLLDLINEILMVSKLNSGKMPAHLEWGRPQPMLEDLSLTAQNLLAAKQGRVEFKAEYQGLEGLMLHTDFNKLRQILMNLISNACKFTEEGVVELKLVKEGGGVVFTVADSGEGMSPADLSVAFDEFRRVEGASRRQTEGTGLGLSLCRKLAVLLDFDLKVESSLGHGTQCILFAPGEYVQQKV